MKYIQNKKTNKEFLIERIYLNESYNEELIKKVKKKYDTVITCTEDNNTDTHFVITEIDQPGTSISFYNNIPCVVTITSTLNFKYKSDYNVEYDSFANDFFEWLEELI